MYVYRPARPNSALLIWRLSVWREIGTPASYFRLAALDRDFGRAPSHGYIYIYIYIVRGVYGTNSMRLLIPLSSANQGSRTVVCMCWSSWSTVEEHILSLALFPTAVSNTCVYLQLWLHFNITQLFLPPPEQVFFLFELPIWPVIRSPRSRYITTYDGRIGKEKFLLNQQ